MTQSIHDFHDDPRNAAIRIWINGVLRPRAEATVSVFDSGFVLGDGVWEGLRVVRGHPVFLDEHLDRLYEGAKAIALDIGLDRATLTRALYDTLAANDMHDGVHLRVMITRGEKSAPNQDPRNALGRPTIAIVSEYKQPSPAIVTTGLSLAQSSIRCSPAEMFDMRLNSHSRLNLIRALLEAIALGADEALMLDPHGFVSSCNATNFFFVSDGVVRTSRGDYCFHGVTRANVIDLCTRHSIPLELGDFTPEDVARADEAFVTGTFGGLTPVRAIDGRTLPRALPGPVTTLLRAHYEALKDAYAAGTS